MFWIAMCNGFMKGQDGCTPYRRRYGVNVEYKQYPFGALVLLHPAEPVVTIKEPKHNKWHDRLVRAVLVGPGGTWGKCYGVIPLEAFTATNRPSRTQIIIRAKYTKPKHKCSTVTRRPPADELTDFCFHNRPSFFFTKRDRPRSPIEQTMRLILGLSVSNSAQSVRVCGGLTT